MGLWLILIYSLYIIIGRISYTSEKMAHFAKHWFNIDFFLDVHLSETWWLCKILLEEHELWSTLTYMNDMSKEASVNLISPQSCNCEGW